MIPRPPLALACLALLAIGPTARADDPVFHFPADLEPKCTTAECVHAQDIADCEEVLHIEGEQCLVCLENDWNCSDDADAQRRTKGKRGARP